MKQPPGRETEALTGVTAISGAVLLYLACALAVAGCRSWSALAATRTMPGVAVTSGCEEESLHALWRATRRDAVYVDPLRLPYVDAYFNWLFYRSYAVVLAASGADGDPTKIPAVSRLFTTILALGGGITLSYALSKVLGGRLLLGTGLAALVWLGPLMGWWIHTARPDAGALAFDSAGLAAVLLLHRTRPMAAALVGSAFFYAAWAFKQTYFLGLASSLLFLAARHQWKIVLVLIGVSLSGWMATFLFLGPVYRESFTNTTTTNVYDLSTGFANLRDMGVKTMPLIFLAAAGLLKRMTGSPSSNTELAGDCRLLGGLGLMVTLPLGFAASCKLGSASYYFFPASIMLTLYAAGSFAPHFPRRLVLTAFALATLFQLTVLMRLAGRLDIHEQTTSLARVWEVWRVEPEPRFAHDRKLNLPWLNPRSPSLVLAFNYELQRAAGRTFEAGGVGGLISSGYFRSLLLPADADGGYDGASLHLYQRGESVGDLTLYRRIEAP